VFQLSSVSASTVFEIVSAHGTNIILHHASGLSCNVIPRFTNDPLDLKWSPLKIEEGEMEGIRNAISFQTIGMPDLPSDKDTTQAVQYSQDNFISRKLRSLR
jgi:hypothetical protein